MIPQIIKDVSEQASMYGGGLRQAHGGNVTMLPTATTGLRQAASGNGAQSFVDSFYGPNARQLPNRPPTRDEIRQFYQVNAGRDPTPRELEYYNDPGPTRRPQRFTQLVRDTGGNRRSQDRLQPQNPVQNNPGPGLGTRTRDSADLAENYPNYSPRAISTDPNNPAQTLADIIAREQERYDYFYKPVENELRASLEDNDIVEDARQNAQSGFGQAAARADRTRSRYGLRQSAAQARASERNRSLSDTLNFDATVNDARIEQKERHDDVRRQLIDIGRGVAGAATGGLRSAANNQANREAANDAADASAKAQRNATVGSLASTALMALLI